MRKFLIRLSFVFGFFTLGAVYGAVAYADEAQTVTYDPAPRAIQCSAAFELMAQAAPKWSAQTAVTAARAAWAARVNAVSTAHGAAPREQVNREMALMADALATRPSDLANLAALCVADAPSN